MSDIDSIVREIDEQLVEIARGVIRRHLDVADPENRRFLEQPDGREQHQTDWHQWGIITHTHRFLQHYCTDSARYLDEWGVRREIDTHLRGEIDGIPRRELLRVSILLHDIGKFGARSRGSTRFHFTRHESLSGEIVRSELDLGRFGLTPAQVEYVARTAEDHFVLGLVRQRARDHGSFDSFFIAGPTFEGTAREIAREHRDDAIEIGVLFLGDSLAKADPTTGPKRAVSQYQLNILVAKRYLEIVVGKEATC